MLRMEPKAPHRIRWGPLCYTTAICLCLQLSGNLSGKCHTHVVVFSYQHKYLSEHGGSYACLVAVARCRRCRRRRSVRVRHLSTSAESSHVPAPGRKYVPHPNRPTIRTLNASISRVRSVECWANRRTNQLVVCFADGRRRRRPHQRSPRLMASIHIVRKHFSAYIYKHSYTMRRYICTRGTRAL